MSGWTASEWLTLQLGPVWVMSALTGSNHVDALYREAFFDAVDAAPAGDSALSWQVMRAIGTNREWLLDEFLLEERSIVSGLSEVATLLERVPVEESRHTREAILRVGHGVARARGPFGRHVTTQDAQTLALLAQLLETAAETAADNPLNATAAL